MSKFGRSNHLCKKETDPPYKIAYFLHAVPKDASANAFAALASGDVGAGEVGGETACTNISASVGDVAPKY